MVMVFTPNSGIAPYVQKLTLYDIPRGSRDNNLPKHSSWLFRNLLIPYQLGRITVKLEPFPSLTHLELSYQWNRTPKMLALIRLIIRKVEVLCFRKYLFETGGIELISLAINLRELKMHQFNRFTRRVVHETETGALVVPPGLHTLRCNTYSEIEILIAWLSRSPNISSIHTLELYPSTEYHAPALSALIRKLGTGLKHLILSIWSFEMDPLRGM